MTRITDDMKTEWFPASVKPVREGVYEVRRYFMDTEIELPPHSLRWNGKSWAYAYRFRFSNAGDHAQMTARDGDCWRGLKAPHDGKTC